MKVTISRLLLGTQMNFSMYEFKIFSHFHTKYYIYSLLNPGNCGIERKAFQNGGWFQAEILKFYATDGNISPFTRSDDWDSSNVIVH